MSLPYTIHGPSGTAHGHPPSLSATRAAPHRPAPHPIPSHRTCLAYRRRRRRTPSSRTGVTPSASPPIGSNPSALRDSEHIISPSPRPYARTTPSTPLTPRRQARRLPSSAPIACHLCARGWIALSIASLDAVYGSCDAGRLWLAVAWWASGMLSSRRTGE